jgi:hypothetical protein
MAQDKYDGVVEAVHYTPDGKIAWVRAYERRGSAFSERRILDRDTLVNRLREGKRYVAGKRVPYLGSTFEVSEALHLVANNGNELLVTGERQAGEDDLKGVPII